MYLSTQLAVFTAAAIEGAVKTRVGVMTLLTRDTPPHPGHRLAPGLGYRLTAIFTVGPSDTARERLARVLDRIGDTLVDLVLYRAIA
jgi:hypothetical protein